MTRNVSTLPRPLIAWILLAAFCNCAGWILSALHQLNPRGYLAALAIGVLAALYLWKRGAFSCAARTNPHHLRRRFTRFFPGAFLVLATLAFLGGLLHPPTNYDALAYRLPRVLNWLADGQWHWIHTHFNRLNTRSCGYEWMAAPVISLFKTDRPLFLIEFAGFVLLPGLFFSVLTRLGVSRRAAWHWMWILPTGYCYLLQAASIGNDMFGAVFALAALDCALRARTSLSHREFWLSIIAVALATGGKTSNLPIALPWLVAVLPELHLLFTRPVPTFVVCAVAALSSFLPMAALNYNHCGDWTGWAAEKTVMGHGDTVLHVTHNCVIWLLQNLAPPIFPAADAWNQRMDNLMPPWLCTRLLRSFEPGEARMHLPELQIEEVSGLGLGVTLLLLLSFWAAIRLRSSTARRSSAVTIDQFWKTLIIVSAWISVTPFLIESGWTTIARLSNPYYGVLIPTFLVGATHARIVRQRWWRAGAAVAFVLAGMLLIVSPGRPLWPAETVLGHVKSEDSSWFLIRAQRVYDVYSRRADAFAPLRACLPPETNTVGIVTYDDPEAALWHPYGTRRFRHIMRTDSRADLQAEGINYALISSDKFYKIFNESIDEWLQRTGGTVVKTVPMDLRAREPERDWYVVRFDFATPTPIVSTNHETVTTATAASR